MVVIARFAEETVMYDMMDVELVEERVCILNKWSAVCHLKRKGKGQRTLETVSVKTTTS